MCQVCICIYSGLCGHSSGENHLLKRNEHRNRLKDHVSWGAVQWGRNNARPGTRRKRAAILQGMEVDGVSHQFVRLSEGLRRGGVLGAGWACIHTQAKGGAGLTAAEWMKRRAEATP